MRLNNTNEGVLNIAFQSAGEEGLPRIDFKHPQVLRADDVSSPMITPTMKQEVVPPLTDQNSWLIGASITQYIGKDGPTEKVSTSSKLLRIIHVYYDRLRSPELEWIRSQSSDLDTLAFTAATHPYSLESWLVIPPTKSELSSTQPRNLQMVAF